MVLSTVASTTRYSSVEGSVRSVGPSVIHRVIDRAVKWLQDLDWIRAAQQITQPGISNRQR